MVRAAGGRLSDRAALAQAANTLVFHGPEPAQWEADNTDGVGLVHDLSVHAGEPLRGRRVLLIGAGGAGAGVLGPLLAARPAELVLANRTTGRAEALVHRHQRHALRHNVRLSSAGLAMPGLQFDVVINASASSLAGVAAPVPPLVLRPGTLAVDLMYGPASRPFLDWAAARRARTRDGLGMLVAQAAEAFALWRGVRPDSAPVLAALRAEEPDKA
jgi:shikimate dehydrogenase